MVGPEADKVVTLWDKVVNGLTTCATRHNLHLGRCFPNVSNEYAVFRMSVVNISTNLLNKNPAFHDLSVEYT